MRQNRVGNGGFGCNQKLKDNGIARETVIERKMKISRRAYGGSVCRDREAVLRNMVQQRFSGTLLFAVSGASVAG